MSEKIEGKLEELVENILEMEPTEKGFNPGVLEYSERKFRVGSQFLRDKKKYEAIKTGQMLRAVAMATQDPEQREKYIRASQPLMIPQLQSRPKK